MKSRELAFGLLAATTIPLAAGCDTSHPYNTYTIDGTVTGFGENEISVDISKVIYAGEGTQEMLKDGKETIEIAEMEVPPRFNRCSPDYYNMDFLNAYTAGKVVVGTHVELTATIIDTHVGCIDNSEYTSTGQVEELPVLGDFAVLP